MYSHLLTLFMTLTNVLNVHGFPLFQKKEYYINPEENPGIRSVFLSEGDIWLDLRRNAVRDLYATWLNRTVPYIIDNRYNAEQRKQMQMAMDEFHANTCIRFIPRSTEPDYLRILPAGGCSSAVGRKGGGQDVSIGDDCDNKGTIMHELMHAIGFFHEHSRPDRDHYITIMWDNIAKEHESNFKSYSSKDIDTLGTRYDYGSIMHYRNNTFAKNRSMPTILPKEPLSPGVEMGQRKKLSETDLLKINILYRCNITHCQDAGTPKNGIRIGDDFKVSKTVQYVCHTGYTLIGSSARFCMDLGEWTGNFPVCLPSNKGGLLHYCNFDQRDLCKWKQDYTDEQNWTHENTGTPSEGTGPKEDHTLGTPAGYYIFLESSKPCNQGDRARLISPTFMYSNTKACLSFYYNMYGKTMGTLNVYQRVGGKSIPKFSLSGNHGQEWHLAVFVLNDASSFQIVIEAVTGSSYKSDMAVDDIVVGSCDSLSTLVDASTGETMSCNFNINTCGWTQAKDDDFDWELEKDSTSSFNTGPNCDPTNCANGTYLYTEASNPRQPGDRARIATPMIKGGGSRCLSFSYHMFGNSMGIMNVYFLELGSDPVLIWHRAGDHGNLWLREQIDLRPRLPFQIIFEGIRGYNVRSDMAIDNVDIMSGDCADIVQFDCDFDHDWCGWTNVQSPLDNIDWIRYNRSTWTPGTGPSSDHTTGTGYFVYIETSGPVVPGSRARLVSPKMTDELSGLCLEFYYHMYGMDVRSLRVLHQPLEGGGQTMSLWDAHGDKGNWWRRQRQFIPSTGQDFQIIFEAFAGGSAGDIAIDDVSIVPGPCTSYDARVMSQHFPFSQLHGR